MNIVAGACAFKKRGGDASKSERTATIGNSHPESSLNQFVQREEKDKGLAARQKQSGWSFFFRPTPGGNRPTSKHHRYQKRGGSGQEITGIQNGNWSTFGRRGSLVRMEGTQSCLVLPCSSGETYRTSRKQDERRTVRTKPGFTENSAETRGGKWRRVQLLSEIFLQPN